LLVMSVTDLEIDEAIWEAWTILHAGAVAPPSAHRLAAALLAITGGTPAHPHWVTPEDLWCDRLAVLAEQSIWVAAWGPRPGEPDCRVPPALLPESRTRRENAYLLWYSTMRVSSDVDAESRNTPKPQSRRRNDAETPAPTRLRTRRRKSPELEPDGSQE
jgi:hypothetical protein